MFCFPKCDISYIYLAEDRATFHVNEGEVENLALSYRFPACRKFKFLSSASWHCFVYVTIFIMHQQMWVTDENNRRIIGMLGRIIGEIFKNCRIE